MRSILIVALSLFITSCGSAAPKLAKDGPRMEASLAATWEATAPARQVAFSRDGRLLATSDAAGLITLRDTRGWKLVEQLRHPGGATSIAFSKDGSHLFSGGYDGSISEWDLSRHDMVRDFTGPQRAIWTIDVSADGQRLAAGGEIAVIRIWKLSRGMPPIRLHGHTRNVWEVRFSPDGRRLASGSFDDTVRLWDAGTGRLLKTLKGHTQAVVGLDFSPDGKLLATGADDSTIRLWRASDGAQLRTIMNGTHVDTVAFSPDGRWIASGGHPRGTIGGFLHQLTGGGGEGPAVRIWRTADAALVTELPHPDDVISLAFSRDGRWLVTSGEDNRFRLWSLRPRP